MVEFIEINGVKHPVILNFYVIGLFQQETGETLNSLRDIPDKLYLIEPLMWYALKAGYIISKQEMSFTRDDMPMMLSDNNTYSKFTDLLAKFFPTETDTKVTPSKKKKL
jgi:hypothetical protein